MDSMPFMMKGCLSHIPDTPLNRAALQLTMSITLFMQNTWDCKPDRGVVLLVCEHERTATIFQLPAWTLDATTQERALITLKMEAESRRLVRDNGNKSSRKRTEARKTKRSVKTRAGNPSAKSSKRQKVAHYDCDVVTATHVELLD